MSLWRRQLSGLWLAVGLGLLPGVAALGQGTPTIPGPRIGSQVVEGVAAVVGDVPIMRSEVEDRFRMLAPQFGVDPADSGQANELRREVVDNLVNEQLLLQEAEAQGLKADPQQLEAVVEDAINGDKERLGADGFARQLDLEGITESELRVRYTEEARKEFLRRQLLQREILSKVSVTDTQVQQYFQTNKEKIGKKPRALRVLDLFLRVVPDSTIEMTYRARAAQVRNEILGGLAFEEAAKRYSDDEKSREDGGRLGRFGPGDLGDRTFESIAMSIAPGAVSEPLRTNLGYHLIQVVERDPGGAWVQIRHILFAIAPSRSDAGRIRGKVDKIREEIVGGKLDFATAVQRYSDDPASRENGGDVGWLPIDSFLGETRTVVENLRVGEVSQVAAVEGGFHLFKLVGEEAEGDFTFDEVRDQVRAAVENEERQKKLDAYLVDLRKKIFVEVRRL